MFGWIPTKNNHVSFYSFARLFAGSHRQRSHSKWAFSAMKSTAGLKLCPAVTRAAAAVAMAANLETTRRLPCSPQCQPHPLPNHHPGSKQHSLIITIQRKRNRMRDHGHTAAIRRVSSLILFPESACSTNDNKYTAQMKLLLRPVATVVQC